MDLSEHFEKLDLDTSDEGRRRRVGRRMARARKELGLSQEQAAEQAGVSQKTVSRLESGQEVGEEVWVALEALYQLPDDYPSAPKDPIRRREFFERAGRTMRRPDGVLA